MARELMDTQVSMRSSQTAGFTAVVGSARVVTMGDSCVSRSFEHRPRYEMNEQCRRRHPSLPGRGIQIVRSLPFFVVESQLHQLCCKDTRSKSCSSKREHFTSTEQLTRFGTRCTQDDSLGSCLWRSSPR